MPSQWNPLWIKYWLRNIIQDRVYISLTLSWCYQGNKYSVNMTKWLCGEHVCLRKTLPKSTRRQGIMGNGQTMGRVTPRCQLLKCRLQNTQVNTFTLLGVTQLWEKNGTMVYQVFSLSFTCFWGPSKRVFLCIDFVAWPWRYSFANSKLNLTLVFVKSIFVSVRRISKIKGLEPYGIC